MQTFGTHIQGDFFNWSYPKNHKYGKKLKYQNWSYPKNHKYGKKLKYQKVGNILLREGCTKKNPGKSVVFCHTCDFEGRTSSGTLTFFHTCDF